MQPTFTDGGDGKIYKNAEFDIDSRLKNISALKNDIANMQKELDAEIALMDKVAIDIPRLAPTINSVTAVDVVEKKA